MRQSRVRARVSIIIPVKELNAYLRESLPVLLRMGGPAFEIWLLPNDYENRPSGTLVPVSRLSKDPYFTTLKAWNTGKHRLRLMPTGAMGPAGKRDLAARKTRSEILAFLDDDAWPRKDWLEKALPYFDGDADAVGGPAVTPLGAGALEEGLGLVFETLLGGGTQRYRYRPVGAPAWVDDFPSVNLLVRRKAFLSAGGFDSPYWPGEDTQFCLAFVKAGYRIRYAPDVFVWHHRRPDVSSHLRQVGAYGLHRGFFVKRFPETSRRPAYFAPSLFLAGVALGWLPALLWSPWLPVYLVGHALYHLFNLGNVAWLTAGRPLPRRLRLIALTASMVFITHLVYGLHFLRGLATRNLKSRLR
jgi:hypothetical protein